jgi:hypothetical protein
MMHLAAWRQWLLQLLPELLLLRRLPQLLQEPSQKS